MERFNSIDFLQPQNQGGEPPRRFPPTANGLFDEPEREPQSSYSAGESRRLERMWKMNEREEEDARNRLARRKLRKMNSLAVR